MNSRESEETSDSDEYCVQGGWCTLCVRKFTSENGMPALQNLFNSSLVQSVVKDDCMCMESLKHPATLLLSVILYDDRMIMSCQVMPV